MGHHCHGLTHLSWAERKIFYRVLGKKFCGLFIYPGQSVRQVVFTGFWVKNFVGCSFTLDSQCGRLWLYQPPATGA
ncbi:hypothetical protein BFD12_22540 [Escherichia coli]|nr:hypothetical protein BFD12_22540 [Escherichia coli]